MESKPLFVDTAEAARLLSCSTRTIRTLAAEGILRRVYVGTLVRYSVVELESLTERRTPPRKRREVAG